jgi:GNAT superfamily N-acetyltransferase
MTPAAIIYRSGGLEHLETIRPLWQALNRHHQSISPHFEQEFAFYMFEQRVAKLRQAYADQDIHLDIAWLGERPVAYLISAISRAGIGELESIYVEAEFRGQGIGDQLMKRGLAWLQTKNPVSIEVKVAVGNEDAYPFYARYGFYPRLVTLKQKTRYLQE